MVEQTKDTPQTNPKKGADSENTFHTGRARPYFIADSPLSRTSDYLSAPGQNIQGIPHDRTAVKPLPPPERMSGDPEQSLADAFTSPYG